MSEVDTEYANVTGDFNTQVNGATLAKAQTAVHAYEAALEHWIGELQSTATSAPFRARAPRVPAGHADHPRGAPHRVPEWNEDDDRPNHPARPRLPLAWWGKAALR
jgi:hypothetical protein